MVFYFLHKSNLLWFSIGQQGSFLGLEVEVPKKSYSTQLIVMDSEKGVEKQVKIEDGGFLKGDIVTLTIPQVSCCTAFSVVFVV